MTIRIPTTRLNAEEAVTATQGIKTVIGKLVEALGVEVITQEVIDLFDELQQAALPLKLVRKPTSSIERREVDTASDHVWDAIFVTCESRIAAYDQKITPLTEKEKAELDACELIIAALFNEGTSPLRARFSQQYGWTEINLNQLRRRNVADAVEMLGLKRLMGLATRLHAEYGKRMGFTETESVDSLTVWHETLEAFVAMVIAKHRGSDIRDQLTAPYEEIAQANRDASRAKKPDKKEGAE